MFSNELAQFMYGNKETKIEKKAKEKEKNQTKSMFYLILKCANNSK